MDKYIGKWKITRCIPLTTCEPITDMDRVEFELTSFGEVEWKAPPSARSLPLLMCNKYEFVPGTASTGFSVLRFGFYDSHIIELKATCCSNPRTSAGHMSRSNRHTSLMLTFESFCIFQCERITPSENDLLGKNVAYSFLPALVNGNFSDLTVHGGSNDQKFEVHRCILESSAPGVSWDSFGLEAFNPIAGCPEDVMGSVIHFVYSESLPKAMTERTAEKLVELTEPDGRSPFSALSGLRNLCLKFLGNLAVQKRLEKICEMVEASSGRAAACFADPSPAEVVSDPLNPIPSSSEVLSASPGKFIDGVKTILKETAVTTLYMFFFCDVLVCEKRNIGYDAFRNAVYYAQGLLPLVLKNFRLCSQNLAFALGPLSGAKKMEIASYIVPEFEYTLTTIGGIFEEVHKILQLVTTSWETRVNEHHKDSFDLDDSSTASGADRSARKGPTQSLLGRAMMKSKFIPTAMVVLREVPPDIANDLNFAGGDTNQNICKNPYLEAQESVVHNSAQSGDIETLFTILSHDFTVVTAPEVGLGASGLANAGLSDYTTPLHLAAQNGHADAVTLLLAAGANPNPVDEMGRTALGFAKENLHEECEEILKEAGARINPEDETFDGKYWNKRLHTATEDGDLETVKAIVTRKLCSSVDAVKSIVTDDTPLFVAVREGHLDIAKFLLTTGEASPLKRLRTGRTPLHIAVEDSKHDAVKVLLANMKKESIEKCLLEKDQSKYTPFHRAAQTEDFRIAVLLLAAGADLDEPMPDGKTFVETAHSAENPATAALRALWLILEPLYKTLDELQPDMEEDMKAISEMAEIALPSSKVKIETAEEAAKDEQARSLNLGTPSEQQLNHERKLWKDFTSAIEIDDAEKVVELLPAFIEHNKDLPDPSQTGEILARGTRGSLMTRALMHFARRGSDTDVLRALLKHFPSIDINAKDSDGYTALHMAVNNANPPFVKILLEAGADPNAKNCVSLTPLDLAMFRRIGVEDRGNMVMKRRCAEEISKFTGLQLPAEFMDFIRILENENPEFVEDYLNEHPEICKSTDFIGRGPLHWVADYPYWVDEMKSSKMAEIILRKGGDELIKVADKRGDTPLHLTRKPSLVRFLLDKGADIEAKNVAGNVPLDSMREELEVYDATPVPEAYDELERNPVQFLRRKAALDFNEMEFDEKKFNRLSKAERKIFESKLEELREDVMDLENDISALEKKIRITKKDLDDMVAATG